MSGDAPAGTRHDVDDAPLLGAYAARQCPARTQYDVLQPVEARPPRDALRARMAAGVGHESDVVDDLAAWHGLVDADVPTDPAGREAWTLDAMRGGAPLVVGGRLPTDEAGHRVGEPDLLVREGDEPVEGRWRYRAADVKHHLVLGGEVPAVLRALSAPALGPAPDPDQAERVGRRRQADLLQVAHYQRMLEACGHAVAGPAWGGVVGSEGTLAWFPLDHPLWQTPARSDGRRRRTRTTMERYDFEFAFRLDIAAVATRHREDPSTDLLVVPISCTECADCPWRGHCLPLMRDREDVSLLPGMGVRDVLVHRDAGVTTIPDLAAVDPATADERYDPPPGNLARVVDLARVWCAPEPAYRRRGVDRVEVPRGDVEVDLDVEQDPGASVVLWGVRVDDRAGLGVEPPEAPFVTWAPEVGPAVETELFVRFWRWLRHLRGVAHAAGASVSVQCWSAGTEAGALRRVGEAAGLAADVEELLGGPEWVDLRRVVDHHLLTPRGTGLKHVAHLAGFRWRDEDPSGLAALGWWADAVEAPDAHDRVAARERLLAYNADDVAATAAVRRWLATTEFSSVADLEP